MKMVARLPEGVPTEFRRKLWLTLADKYLTNKGVDWKRAERTCFNEWSNPDDDELGLQIVRVSFSKILFAFLSVSEANALLHISFPQKSFTFK